MNIIANRLSKIKPSMTVGINIKANGINSLNISSCVNDIEIQ